MTVQEFWQERYYRPQNRKPIFYLLSIVIYRKWVMYVFFCSFDLVQLSILWRQSINLSHIPLYCTSNFSLLSLFLCLPSLSSPPLSEPPEWRLRIDGRPFQSALLRRNAYIWSLTPHRALIESQVHRVNVGNCDL